ncbi:DUF7344 domain-containing protein [Halobaculum limi]|uniref:DUF7344 domain-containing protein n=1 Tax=Halobaculum limi TaxID=3031916 RepID=UPI0024067D4E|nr:hypothetical protein [Halobaculum sp. YSMS11]
MPRVTEDDEQAVVETEHVDEQEESEPAEIPLDLTFEILKNERRRLVLEYLRDVDDGQTTIGELAEHIAAIENDCDIQALGAQQRKRVYIGLYQCHLPKMDDAGVVDFNQSRGFVELRPEADPLFEYLVEDDESEDDIESAGDMEEDFLPLAGATLGIGVLFGISQLLGYHLLASLFVFAFLAFVLYTGRDQVMAQFA